MRKIFAATLGTLALGAACKTNLPEVGVEWINVYEYDEPHVSCNQHELGGRDDTAIGFYRVLTDNGYVGRFQWGDANAWSNDFVDSDVDPSGDDHNWVDTVDFAYHADHGNVGVFGFGRAKDDCIVSANQCRWGDDSDLEWIVLDDCSELREDGYEIWTQVFQGLHMILSFDTLAHDSSNRGEIFAKKLVAGWTIRQAWWYACEQTEGSETYAAILGACDGDVGIYDEHAWKFGSVSADPVPIAWWWWTHHGC